MGFVDIPLFWFETCNAHICILCGKSNPNLSFLSNYHISKKCVVLTSKNLFISMFKCVLMEKTLGSVPAHLRKKFSLHEGQNDKF